MRSSVVEEPPIMFFSRMVKKVVFGGRAHFFVIGRVLQLNSAKRWFARPSHSSVLGGCSGGGAWGGGRIVEGCCVQK